MDEPVPAVPGTPGPGIRAPAAPRPPRGQRLRPGLLWYWVALAALLAGIALPLLGVRATDMKIAAFHRVPLPRGGRVTLPHAGTYVISYEADGASVHNLPTFRIRARPVTRALRVRLRPDISGAEYASGSADGVAVLELTASGPGTVFLDGPAAPAVRGGSQLAVGTPLPGFLATAMPGIGLMLLGFAGIVLVATWRNRATLRRGRHRAPPS